MNISLTVLQSFPAPRPTTNPYLVMLSEGLEEQQGVRVLNFSWRKALLRRYDVFHVHWPENLVNGHTPVKKVLRQGLSLLLLAKLAITRTPIIRTLHNIELPEGISRAEVLILKLIAKQTTFCITLNALTQSLKCKPSTTILHGHYRDWFAQYCPAESVPGQIGYVGLIRRYKGVEGLLSAFHATDSLLPGLSLRVGGKPSTTKLSTELVALAGNAPGITLQMHFLTDDQLVEIVTSSELVVLPYRFMHNSGGTLAALSLNRPVLIPDNAVNRQLADEVGDGWVHLFTGDISAADITDTIKKIRQLGPIAPPDLRARSWQDTGYQHVAVYRQAMSWLGGTRKVGLSIWKN